MNVEPMIKYINTTNFDLEIRPSLIKNAGFGIFTNQDLKKNILIGYYTGDKKNKNDTISDYSFEISKTLFIDAEKYPRSYIAMINDSYNSQFENNCEFRLVYYDKNYKRLKINDMKIVLYTIKDINKNEELFAAYSPSYWLSRSIKTS
jgi:hypothetical protein